MLDDGEGLRIRLQDRLTKGQEFGARYSAGNKVIGKIRETVESGGEVIKGAFRKFYQRLLDVIDERDPNRKRGEEEDRRCVLLLYYHIFHNSWIKYYCLGTVLQLASLDTWPKVPHRAHLGIFGLFPAFAFFLLPWPPSRRRRLPAGGEMYSAPMTLLVAFGYTK